MRITVALTISAVATALPIQRSQQTHSNLHTAETCHMGLRNSYGRMCDSYKTIISTDEYPKLDSQCLNVSWYVPSNGPSKHRLIARSHLPSNMPSAIPSNAPRRTDISKRAFDNTTHEVSRNYSWGNCVQWTTKDGYRYLSSNAVPDYYFDPYCPFGLGAGYCIANEPCPFPTLQCGVTKSRGYTANGDVWVPQLMQVRSSVLSIILSNVPSNVHRTAHRMFHRRLHRINCNIEGCIECYIGCCINGSMQAKLPAVGNPTRSDRPGDMYSSVDEGECNVGAATGFHLNGISIQGPNDAGATNVPSKCPIERSIEYSIHRTSHRTFHRIFHRMTRRWRPGAINVNEAGFWLIPSNVPSNIPSNVPSNQVPSMSTRPAFSSCVVATSRRRSPLRPTAGSKAPCRISRRCTTTTRRPTAPRRSKRSRSRCPTAAGRTCTGHSSGTHSTASESTRTATSAARVMSEHMPEHMCTRMSEHVSVHVSKLYGNVTHVGGVSVCPSTCLHTHV